MPPPHELAAQAAQHAATCAEQTRQMVAELHELIRDVMRPAVVQPVQLSPTNHPLQVRAVRGAKSFTVINNLPGAVNVWVGFGGRSASPGSGVLVPAAGANESGIRSFPWDAGDIEIDFDPALPPAGQFECFVVRYYHPIEAR